MFSTSSCKPDIESFHFRRHVFHFQELIFVLQISPLKACCSCFTKASFLSSRWIMVLLFMLLPTLHLLPINPLFSHLSWSWSFELEALLECLGILGCPFTEKWKATWKLCMCALWVVDFTTGLLGGDQPSVGDPSNVRTLNCFLIAARILSEGGWRKSFVSRLSLNLLDFNMVPDPSPPLVHDVPKPRASLVQFLQSKLLVFYQNETEVARPTLWG